MFPKKILIPILALSVSFALFARAKAVKERKTRKKKRKKNVTRCKHTQAGAMTGCGEKPTTRRFVDKEKSLISARIVRLDYSGSSRLFFFIA